MLDKKVLNKIHNYFFCQKDVVAVYLYGSEAEGISNKLSDVDLAVLLDNKRISDSFQRRLEFIGKVQALIGSKDADVKILDFNLPLSFLHQVLKHGRPIVINYPGKKEDFELKVISFYLDFKPVLEDYYSKMHQRIKEGFYAQA